MLNPTEIEWCDRTFNPITGCLHGCSYCYARKQARRFTGNVERNLQSDQLRHIGGGLYELDAPFVDEDGCRLSFPAWFAPTLHKYRLNDPAKTKRSYNVFVGSMADVFGEWVPDEWIKAVFDACKAAPQHNYLFLTKNPQRYNDLLGEHLLPTDNNFWFGGTRTGKDSDREHEAAMLGHTFLSIEPMLAPMERGTLNALECWDWIILGAMGGPGASQNQPKREWIEEIVDYCQRESVPIFMKDSLADIWGEPLVREYPPQLQPRPAHRPKRRIPVKCVLDPVCCDECETPLQGKPAVRLGVKRYECPICYEKLEAISCEHQQTQ